MKKRNLCVALSALLSLLGMNTAVAAAPQETLYGDRSTTVRHPEWIKNAVIYEVNLRQGTQGRTINSFRKELPRLRDLGVDVLWLMPVHPISKVNRKGTLGSYYAVADYKAVNPEFGTIDDLKGLVKEAHDMGMKVILDEVCNHSGCDNAWVTEHAEYYQKDKDGKMYGPFDWTDTYKLDYSNPGLRAAMLDALRFWVKEADIDGYRCDVAAEVPVTFWDEARKELDAIKPVFMLAEASAPVLTLNAFDADYNWPMKDVFNAIAASKGANQYAVKHNQKLPAANALSIDSLMQLQDRQYPRGARHMLMITNHDLNSWEGTEFDRLGPATGAFAVLTYTLPGMPMLYTGQEVGFNHPFEFFETDPVTPVYNANEFTSFYEILNTLRHNNKALWSDDAMAPVTRYGTTDGNIYIFSRERDGDKVVVVANLQGEPARVDYTGTAPSVMGMTNIFSGLEEEFPQQLKPWEYRVYSTK